MAAAQPNSLGNYWHIKAPNGAVSHLWGTIHSNNVAMLRLPEPVLAQIRAARVIALEIDPIFSSRRALDQRNLGDDIVRPRRQADLDLSTLLDTRVFNWLQSRAHGLGLGNDAVQWLSIGALVEVALWDPCNDFAFGVLPAQDSYIQTQGMLAGAKIMALEDQRDLFETVNAKQNQQLALDIISLYGASSGPQAHPDARSTYFALYQNGQNGLMQAWERAAADQFFGAPHGNDLVDRVDAYLLTQRNQTFLDAGRAALQNGGVFMAVGSFHLPGTTGLIERLRAEGFILTRIPLPNEPAQ